LANAAATPFFYLILSNLAHADKVDFMLDFCYEEVSRACFAFDGVLSSAVRCLSA